MKGVSISDSDPVAGTLSFDLRDILPCLGQDGERSLWTLQDVECFGGDAARVLHDASESQRVISGVQLIKLARDVGQIVDGVFSARLPGAARMWVSVRAVDSSAYDVETEREDVLSALRSQFRQVEAIPG